LDEEALTVHFVHPSAKQHLLLADMENSPSQSSRFTEKEATTLMGSICVTYLNWNVFETQLIPQYKPWLTDGSTTLNAVANSPFQSNGFAKKVAQMYLKRTRHSSSVSDSPSFDFKRALMDVYSATDQKHPIEEFHFLPYPKQYWLHHTKEISSWRGNVNHLWYKLCNNPPTIIDSFPWGNSLSSTTEDDFQRRLEWAFQNRHISLGSSVVLRNRPRFLQFMEEKEADALKLQLIGNWHKAAEIRCDILDFLKLDISRNTLDFLKATWNLALSYQAIEEEQNKVEDLLRGFLLQLKTVNNPFVDSILDSSIAFQTARNNNLQTKVAEKLLESASLLSRSLLGDSVGTTQLLQQDLAYFEERRVKSLAL
jgi:hypothetical protein